MTAFQKHSNSLSYGENVSPEKKQDEQGMKNSDLDIIMGDLAEMRLIAEVALSIFEKSDRDDAEAFSLIGEALYMIRDKVTECLEAGRK